MRKAQKFKKIFKKTKERCYESSQNRFHRISFTISHLLAFLIDILFPCKFFYLNYGQS